MAFKNVNFTNYEESDINKIMDINIMRKVYNPTSVDDIKFNNNFNIDPFNKDKLKYLNIWANLVIKNPKIAIEAYLSSTLGYWYPNVDYWIYNQIDNNEFNIYRDSKAPVVLEKVINKLNSKNSPLSLIWSIGTGVIILFISILIAILKRGKRILICYIPVIGLWLTLMVAAPVYAEFRYIFGLYTAFPLYILIPFLKEKI